MTFVIGIAIFGCAGISLHYHDSHAVVMSLVNSGLIIMGFAIICGVLTRGNINLSRRDGFGVVTFGWLIAAVFGSLPYILSGIIPHPIPALFETLSGFTTTGASVLGNLETIPRGIHFWRALTHRFGGMGVLVPCVAILPFLGVGGMQIYRAEVPGPAKDRLPPRINVIFRKMFREIRLFMRPMSVIQMKYDGRVVEADTVSHIAAFTFMYLCTCAIAVLLMCLYTPDLETALSSVATTLGGMGPGLNAVGATHNFSVFPNAGHLVLIACMLLGRLEFYTVFVLFLPSFWKK